MKKVCLKTAIHKVADTESMRLALSGVHVAPREGRVVAAATDGRCLAVVPLDADSEWEPDGNEETDKGAVLPVDVCPKKRAEFGKEIELQNGEFKASYGRVGKPLEGKFPEYPDVVPSVHYDSHYAIIIDVRLLAKMADALGDPGDNERHKLTLLIPYPEEGVVEEAVAVMGQHGIGVIMPFGDHDNPHKEMRDKCIDILGPGWGRYHEDYVTRCAEVFGWSKPQPPETAIDPPTTEAPETPVDDTEAATDTDDTTDDELSGDELLAQMMADL